MVNTDRRKVIWLVCANAQPPEIDTHLRHQKFAEMLSREGYEVYIIAGSYLHYNQHNLINTKEKYIIRCCDNKKYIFINVSSYKSNGKKRIFSIAQFGYRIYRLRNSFPHPQIIVHNTRIPFDSSVYFAAKKLKAKYVAEIWDLWPESFVSFGIIKKSNPLLKIAYLIEKFIYTKADKLIFTMEGAKDYIREKKWDADQGGSIDMSKYNYINNGIDIGDFEYNKLHYTLSDPDLSDPNTFKIIYLGSIRLVNNLKLLIDAAAYLQDRSDIVFLIYGDGDERAILESYCKKNDIRNVRFKEKWVEIKYVPYILSCGSLHIMNYKRNDIEKYGGSQGKLFQYLASGKPIVSNNIMGYDIINKYHAGISKNFKTAQEYAQAIREIASLDQNEYNRLCLSSSETAVLFDFKSLFKKYLKVISELG